MKAARKEEKNIYQSQMEIEKNLKGKLKGQIEANQKLREIKNVQIKSNSDQIFSIS